MVMMWLTKLLATGVVPERAAKDWEVFGQALSLVGKLFRSVSNRQRKPPGQEHSGREKTKPPKGGRDNGSEENTFRLEVEEGEEQRGEVAG